MDCDTETVTNVLSSLPHPVLAAIWQRLGYHARRNWRAACQELRCVVDEQMTSSLTVVMSAAVPDDPLSQDVRNKTSNLHHSSPTKTPQHAAWHGVGKGRAAVPSDSNTLQVQGSTSAVMSPKADQHQHQAGKSLMSFKSVDTSVTASLARTASRLMRSVSTASASCTEVTTTRTSTAAAVASHSAASASSSGIASTKTTGCETLLSQASVASSGKVTLHGDVSQQAQHASTMTRTQASGEVSQLLPPSFVFSDVAQDTSRTVFMDYHPDEDDDSYADADDAIVSHDGSLSCTEAHIDQVGDHDVLKQASLVPDAVQQWDTMVNLVSKLTGLKHLSITLLPDMVDLDLEQAFAQLSCAAPCTLRHIHVDVRCAELTAGLLASVATAFPQVTSLQVFGLGNGLGPQRPTTMPYTHTAVAHAAHDTLLQSGIGNSMSTTAVLPRTSDEGGATPAATGSALQRCVRHAEHAAPLTWQEAFSLLPSQLVVFHCGSVDQEGWYRKFFCQSNELEGLSHLRALRELKLTGLTHSEHETSICMKPLEFLVNDGSLTHITLSSVPAYRINLQPLTSWSITRHCSDALFLSGYADAFRGIRNIQDRSQSVHFTNGLYRTHSMQTLSSSNNLSAWHLSTSEQGNDLGNAPVTGYAGSYLGVAASAASLRAAAAANWTGFWSTLTTLWLRGMADDFTIQDVALLGTMPALRELFMSSCFQRGRLSMLPPGSLSKLTTLKLWWATSSDLQPGELAALLNSGVLSPQCRLVLTSGPCVERSKHKNLLAADCKALAAHPGGWTTQLTSRQVLCEMHGLILFYERAMGEGLAEAMAPILPTIDGLVVSSPTPEIASDVLSAPWLTARAPNLHMLGAQCNEWPMLCSLLEAATQQVQCPTSKLRTIIARTWGQSTVANLATPEGVDMLVKLLQSAPEGFVVRVCVEEGGMMEALKTRVSVARALQQHGCDPDAVQLLIW